ncbi:hypothetical protein [Herbidospora cretacea]|uniref:hypothetical protein n=1 Tax=Herbidospora cretacea TaxID=28444 RepID=UPI0018CC1388
MGRECPRTRGRCQSPRAQAGPNPQHLLTTLLGEFGISESSARAALSRLTRRGLIAVTAIWTAARPSPDTAGDRQASLPDGPLLGLRCPAAAVGRRLGDRFLLDSAGGPGRAALLLRRAGGQRRLLRHDGDGYRLSG